jgi:hypothetical protein
MSIFGRPGGRRVIPVVAVVFGLATLGVSPASVLAEQPPTSGPLVIRGTVLVPGGVIRHGYVVIQDGRIAAVSSAEPKVAGATRLNTSGIIAPGFVDLHNHVSWNVIPRWSPGPIFTNRSQWRSSPDQQAQVRNPHNAILPTSFCDMNAYGELRALVGGATSIIATRAQPCVTGLIRNLDFNSGFYGTSELDREHILSELELPSPTSPLFRAGFVQAAQSLIANPKYEALLIHLAEGTDDAAHEEFEFIQSQSLLNPKGVIIHGIPLVSGDFEAMAETGTALVWSPRSNVELYGQTADVLAALDAGVDVALAPDWAVTGSSNVLDELRFAADWNRQHLGGRLSNEQLVDMVTAAPARIGGIDDEVGAIVPGLRADLVIIDGSSKNPYDALVEATTDDVQLVLVNGVPLLGDRRDMQRLWGLDDLETVVVAGTPKVLAASAFPGTFTQMAARLSAALAAQGTTLAPLAEPH